jgi:hypothetical protein
MIAQRQELSEHCGLYIQRHPKMNIKVVDGSSLVVATILNNIPKGTNQVLLRGKFNKIALAIINALCTKNVQVCEHIYFRYIFNISIDHNFHYKNFCHLRRPKTPKKRPEQSICDGFCCRRINTCCKPLRQLFASQNRRKSVASICSGQKPPEKST